MSVVLEYKGKETGQPTDEDIARAVAGPRDDDWSLTLHRGEEDYMDVMIDAGDLWVECEEDGTFLQARSYVDEEAVKSMLAAFRDGTSDWRDLALWTPPPPPRKGLPPGVLPIIVGVAVVVLALLGTAIFTGNKGWLVMLFALAFPGIIAIATLVKVAEAKRAAAWTRGTARITRSEMATETRFDKQVTVPRIEYEYKVGFHRFRGKRASFAELVTGPAAKEMLARLRAGTSVPVYYNPADPTESVLERELPPFLSAVWGLVAVLTLLIVGGAWWFLLR